MTEDLIGTLAGFAVMLTIGSAGYFTRSIDWSGLIAGLLIGAVFVLAGGLPATFMLVTFFLVGTAFTKYKYDFKEEIGAAEMKGGARTWKNVVANLLFPTVMLFTYAVTSWRFSALAFTASLSGAFSDTLGSEVGVLSTEPPVMIHNMRKALPGTSGAVSVLGLIASLVGSFLISVEALFFSLISAREFPLVLTLGFFCSIVDSLLGALLQARYKCLNEGKIVEDPSLCDGGVELLRGFRWVDNHIVNLMSTGLTALLSVLGALL